MEVGLTFEKREVLADPDMTKDDIIFGVAVKVFVPFVPAAALATVCAVAFLYVLVTIDCGIDDDNGMLGEDEAKLVASLLDDEDA